MSIEERLLRENEKLLERIERLERFKAWHKRAIDSLKKGRDRFKKQKEFVYTIIDSLPYPFFVIGAKDYRIRLANHAASQMGDWKRQTCFSFIHKIDQPCMTHPCPLKEIKKTKLPAIVEHKHFDAEGNESICEVRGYPVVTNGKINYFIEYIVDITKKKKAEKEIEFLASIIQNIPDAVMAVEIENSMNIVSWNKGAEEILGYKEDEIIGKPLGEIIPPEEKSYEIEFYRKKISEEGSYSSHESVILSNNGKKIPVEITAVGLKDSERNDKYFASIIRDISERKTAEMKLSAAYKELKSLDTLKNDIISNVSHELKTPITIMQGCMELAIEENMPGEKRFLLEKGLTALKRQETIINDLLSLSIVNDFKSDIKPEDMSPIIKEVILDSNQNAQKKNIVINKEIQPNLPKVRIESNRIAQVIQNLIDNAIKFNREYGKILIEAKKIGNYVQVSVSDTGIGIRDEDKEKIFEPLTQLDPSTKRQYGGTGIGLTVCRKIIKMHGGKIWMESNFGAGSIFYFTLPISARIN